MLLVIQTTLIDLQLDVNKIFHLILQKTVSGKVTTEKRKSTPKIFLHLLRTDLMCGDHERLEHKITPKYLKEDTLTKRELLRKRGGRERMKGEVLRVTIIYLVLLVLIDKW